MYLKEFRERLNLTQKELAEKLDVAQTTIARYETNKVKPTTDTIMKYIEKVDANPLFLFTGKEPYKLSDIPGLNNESYIVLSDLRKILNQDEIQKKLEEIFIDEILSKFQISDEEKSPMYKFFEAIKLEGHIPVRPFLFLYYIFQFIVQDENKNSITDYRQYLIDIVLSFKTLSWHNNPIFTNKIKDEISARFELEISKEECQVLVTNAETTLKKLEEKMPASMIKAHRKINLKSLFPDKFK
ncbi:helix-turn-helix domain-containing protein [Sulfurimonas paralvinellae]|uniref:Helix-turn-helix transcriptional regulator n=1 Tax=Sulfurimonas paralvinellae TaxID=317658 RepID=A0A7M1B795_9BACT|nr:helix-turn-helix transcriptional regulator [Sulfurimonas paralvinellae]QOP45550.1 helix-turn-helix transcriptional regulator [Sulfurimonas paralvinellae]